MRLRIGSGFGIPIYLHWTFFLLPLWILWSRPEESPVGLDVVFTLVPLVFACVVLHEFGHALMARRFGIATQDVTLYPIGGVARLMRMSDKPHEELLIAVAGPAVNVVIAILLTVLIVAVALIDPGLVFHALPGNLDFFREVVGLLLAGNILMVLFNLLPAFPMDGGRVLRALLSAWLGHYQATQIAVAIGVGMAILMGIAGLTPYFHSPMLAVIGVFIFFAGQQELMAARFREHQLRRQHDEEPLTVLPVRPAWPTEYAPATAQAPLLLQPKISVYTWDNQTGTWRKEPGQLT
jgi:Zn-dependent protease